MAIPFLAIEGYHTLLASRAGSFIEEPTRSEPGWRAFVEPTPVVGVAEVDAGTVTGVALLVHHPEVRSAGTVILAPGSLEVDGSTLSQLPATDAVAAVADALRLAIARVDVLDQEGWQRVLGDRQYRLNSPDPVDDRSGAPLFTVGEVTIDGSNAAAFLGRPADGAAPVSVQPRRHLFWEALLADGPVTDDPLAVDLRSMAGSVVQIVDLPVTQLEPVALLDREATELLVRDVVAYPAAAVAGDRLQVRILDRSGGADLENIAGAVAAHGMEVIEIGNAVPFDDGETQILAPVALVSEEGLLPASVAELSRSVGIDRVIVDNDAIDDAVVTVVIGRDFDLANLR